MQGIPHDTRLTVVLTAQDWNTVVGLLTEAQAPYRLTAPLIASMQQQLTEQAQATEGADVSRQN